MNRVYKLKKRRVVHFPIDDNKKLEKENDLLWPICVKINAGLVCEWNPKSSDSLQAHHSVVGRANPSTRWIIDQGICLSQSVHYYFHHATGSNLFMNHLFVIRKIGFENIDRILYLKGKVKDVDIERTNNELKMRLKILIKLRRFKITDPLADRLAATEYNYLKKNWDHYKWEALNE